MKTFFGFWILLIIAFGCTKENSSLFLDKTPEERSIVRFSRYSISGAETKAPITTITELAAEGAKIGVLRAPDAASAVWTSVSSATTTASVSTSGVVTPTATQLYNSNTALKAWFMLYYPNTNTAISANKVNWTITGQEDIMTTGTIDAGSKSSPVTPSVTFTHRLAQLQFQVKGLGSNVGGKWGTLTYIKVTAATSLDLTMSTNAFAANSTPVNADLPTSIGSSAAINLGTTYVSAGSVMVLPGTSYSVKVKTSLVTERVITVTITTTAGQTHLISLDLAKTP